MSLAYHVARSFPFPLFYVNGWLAAYASNLCPPLSRWVYAVRVCVCVCVCVYVRLGFSAGVSFAAQSIYYTLKLPRPNFSRWRHSSTYALWVQLGPARAPPQSPARTRVSFRAARCPINLTAPSANPDVVIEILCWSELPLTTFLSGLRLFMPALIWGLTAPARSNFASQ